MPRAGPRKVAALQPGVQAQGREAQPVEGRRSAGGGGSPRDSSVHAVAVAKAGTRRQRRAAVAIRELRDPTRYCRALISERRRAANRLPKALQDTPRFVALNHRTAEGRPESRGRPEQAADASDVKRRGGAEVRVGCSGAAATSPAELKLCPTFHSCSRRAAPPGAPRFRRHSPPLSFDGLRRAGRESRVGTPPSRRDSCVAPKRPAGVTQSVWLRARVLEAD